MPTAGGCIHCLSKTNKGHNHCNLLFALQTQKRNKNLSHLVLTLHPHSRHPLTFLGEEMKEGIGDFSKKRNLTQHKLFLCLISFSYKWSQTGSSQHLSKIYFLSTGLDCGTNSLPQDTLESENYHDLKESETVPGHQQTPSLQKEQALG